MPSTRSAKRSCDKPFLPKHEEILTRIARAQPGNLWRQPMLNAMKRAGASVYIDEKRRLQVVFGEHAVHPCRLAMGHAEDNVYATPLGQQLQAMAMALLLHKTGRSPS